MTLTNKVYFRQVLIGFLLLNEMRLPLILLFYALDEWDSCTNSYLLESLVKLCCVSFLIFSIFCKDFWPAAFNFECCLVLVVEYLKLFFVCKLGSISRFLVGSWLNSFWFCVFLSMSDVILEELTPILPSTNTLSSIGSKLNKQTQSKFEFLFSIETVCCVPPRSSSCTIPNSWDLNWDFLDRFLFGFVFGWCWCEGLRMWEDWNVMSAEGIGPIRNWKCLRVLINEICSGTTTDSISCSLRSL